MMSSITKVSFCILNNTFEIGGIETLIIRLVRYLNSLGEEPTLLVAKVDSFIPRTLNEMHAKFHAYLTEMTYNYSSNVGAMPCRLKVCVDRSLIFCPDFHTLQHSLSIFEEENRVFAGFFHPEAWSNRLFTFRNHKIKPVIKNNFYSYQQNLLQMLNSKNATWFMNEVTKEYNEYYYNISLSKSRIIPLPFDIEKSCKTFVNENVKKSDCLRVLWLGRFDYFKNPAIKKTLESLQQLTESYKELKVEFDLIGYGKEKYVKDIRKEVKTSGRLQVKYLGKIFPDRLPEVIAQYDVGVAMGTSALHIGGMRIPSILVDASDEKHINQIKGCWLHEAPVGFLGEGVYADICGYRIEARRDLTVLFKELLDLGNQFELIGNRCYEYILEHYDENKIMPQIIDAWTSSTFSPGDMEAYRHPPLKRFIRRAGKRILSRWDRFRL